MSIEKLMKVILGPHISEKSSRLGEQKHQIVFKVLRTATKKDIKEAVEHLFEVKVDGVRVLNTKPKRRRYGQTEGTKKAWKKAYVSLQEGYDINFTGLE